MFEKYYIERVLFFLGNGQKSTKKRISEKIMEGGGIKKSYTITFYSVGVTIKTYYEKTCVKDNAALYTGEMKIRLRTVLFRQRSSFEQEG